MTEFEKFVVYGALLGAAPVTRKILEACSYNMTNDLTGKTEIVFETIQEPGIGDTTDKPIFQLKSYPLPVTRVKLEMTGREYITQNIDLCEELPNTDPDIELPYKDIVTSSDLSVAAAKLGYAVEKLIIAALLEFAKRGDESTLHNSKFYGPYERAVLDDKELIFQITPDVCQIIVAKLPEVVGDEMQCIIAPKIQQDMYGVCGVVYTKLSGFRGGVGATQYIK